jgi:hypothetical protein
MTPSWFYLLALTVIIAILFVIGLWLKEPKPPRTVRKIERTYGPDGEPGVQPTKKQIDT